VIGLEADLRLLQDVDQARLLLARPFQPVLDFALEASELLPVLMAVATADGSGELVEQVPQMLFHSRERYRTSGLYLIRWGWAASAPRRFLRSAS
jgi:hypothetical protein